MKTVIVVRHAKSSWDSNVVSDHDRPLNDRGLRDAPIMAKRLFEAGVPIDGFISSTANRALATATFFAQQYGKQNADILQWNFLYHAPPRDIWKAVQQADESWDHIAIFCHNPGITEFVNQTGLVRLDNMPTCGLMRFLLDADSWKQASMRQLSFGSYDFPKNG